MSIEKIIVGTKEYVLQELHEATDLKTREDVLCARNRAFGAILLACRLDGDLYEKLGEWWNEEILEDFNDIMFSKPRA